ncbi:MAG TPA: hypothetical protein VF522_04015 [Ramlibacter sp.]|uniref:hypothetical protein n=1 Tax=Ramlibacter sp. TaxID=1917967 RepID=UPI002ED4BA13
MPNRLQLIGAASAKDIREIAYAELKDLTGKTEAASPSTQAPLENCCKAVATSGVAAVLVQRKVQDPDFSAEFAAYYSRQFASVPKQCTRLHLFSVAPASPNETVLDFLDRISPADYLGFITLRPVIKSPVGATILSSSITGGFIRSDDSFPVHIAGKELSVRGTPFMQQDNAVGACAQASIWMALRTLRKREGDRAYDPAQITDAATRYFVTGRTRPNRGGLTQQQMTEAIRAAGYSPHLMPLGDFWYSNGHPAMSDDQLDSALRAIHPYVESQIPVVLILFPPSGGGHAVVAIGHTWTDNPQAPVKVKVNRGNGKAFRFTHAASWTPSLIVHNDNTGPYRLLDRRNPADYSLEHGASAIPLLPTDVFMSAEEAFELGLQVVSSLFDGFVTAKLRTDAEMEALTDSLVVRLSLVDKRKIRQWAAVNPMSPELREELRLMELPKRLWAFELHLASRYPQHGHAIQNSLIGLVLIDSTGDDVASSPLLMHMNLPELFPQLQSGAIVKWDSTTGLPDASVKTNEQGATLPVR